MQESGCLFVMHVDTADSREALRRWTYRPRRRHRAWSPTVPGRRWPCRFLLRASYKLATRQTTASSRRFLSHSSPRHNRDRQRLRTRSKVCPLIQLEKTQPSGFPGLENHATDAPKSVDADLHRHCNFDNGTRVRGHTSKNGALQQNMRQQGLKLRRRLSSNL